MTAVANAGRTDDHEAIIGVGGVGKVAGPPAAVEGVAHGGLDSRRGLIQTERQAQHHRGGEDRPDRVRLVLAGDVGRRPVDRLVQTERPVLRQPIAQRRRGEHPEAAREHRGLVRQDVAEQVLGDDDVEVGRAADE